MKREKEEEKIMTTGYVWLLALYPYHTATEKPRCFHVQNCCSRKDRLILSPLDFDWWRNVRLQLSHSEKKLRFVLWVQEGSHCWTIVLRYNDNTFCFCVKLLRVPQTNKQSLVPGHSWPRKQRSTLFAKLGPERHNEDKIASEAPYVNTLPWGTWICLNENIIPAWGFQMHNEDNTASRHASPAGMTGSSSPTWLHPVAQPVPLAGLLGTKLRLPGRRTISFPNFPISPFRGGVFVADGFLRKNHCGRTGRPHGVCSSTEYII